MSKLTRLSSWIIASLMTFQSLPTHATQLDPCKMIATFKARIETDRAKLMSVSDLYQSKLEAQELRSRLPDLITDAQTISLADRLETDQDINNTILLLADALERSAGELGSDSVDILPLEGLSVGALVLSTYIVKRMHRDQKGLKAIFMAHFKTPSSGKTKYLRYGVNMSMLAGVIGTLYLGHRTYKNTLNARELRSIMRELEAISIDAEQIVTLRGQIEEDVVRIEQLEWSEGATCSE